MKFYIIINALAENSAPPALLRPIHENVENLRAEANLRGGFCGFLSLLRRYGPEDNCRPPLPAPAAAYCWVT